MDYDRGQKAVIRGTLMGARDAGLRDPDTGDRLRIIEVMCLEDDVIELYWGSPLLIQDAE